MTAPYPQPPYRQVPPPWAPQAAPYQQPFQQAPYPQQPWQQGPWQQQPHRQQGPWGYPQPVKKGMPAWAIALVVVLAVLMLGGIAAAGGGGKASQTATARQGKAVTAQNGGNDCPGGSLEGCYTEGQMDKFLGQAIWFVQGFSDGSYSTMPHPKGYALIQEGQQVQSACGALTEMTYAYCPGDDRVYIGQKQLWELYGGIGDAAAVVGLAHEYGHHIQQAAGVPDQPGPSGSVVHENQADCIAGAFVGWAKGKGYLEDSDTQDIEGLIQAIASSENDPNRDHGDLQERAQSLSTGISQGLSGCDSFYPGTPVSPAD